jgi:PAS domain S-box-containing protein
MTMAGEIRANHNSLSNLPDDHSFRELAENIPTLCWIADASGYIVWYNPRWYEYTGTTPAMMQGWGWQSVHDPKTLPDILERWTAAICSAQPFEMVIPIRGADGVLRPFLTRINPTFDERGNVAKWFGINTDISLQVRAEDAAVKSEARFRVIADSMPQMVWSARVDGSHDYFNARWYEFTGAPVGSTDGAGWLEVVHPADRDGAAQAWSDARHSGEPLSAEFRLRHRTGAHRWVLARAHAERDAAGSIGRWYGTYTDVEDIVQARTVLQRSREELESEVVARTGERNLLATLVETTDVMIMAIDLNYRIVAINKANADEFERVWGIHPRVGDDILELLAAVPEERDIAKAAWGRVLAGEEIDLVEPRGDPARPRRSYEIKYRVLRNDTGVQIGAFQFAEDVTDQLLDQARLAQAQAALIQAQKLEAMGQLTGGVAHDFNNLLTPIIGSLDILQRRSIHGAREQRLLSAAYQSAERAKTLVQRLLAFARRQPLQPVALDVGALLKGLIELVVSTIGPQIGLQVEVPHDLPSARADPNQLEMAILNLVVNSRDAMDGNGSIRLSARCETVVSGTGNDLKPGRYVRLVVADTGCGMDEATLARAVEPFFSTKGAGQGTGLGLSMAHGLASQLGGALTLESRQGVGTEVSLWLPASEESARATGGAANAEARSIRVGTALLVDDEELIRLSTADMLTDLGFEVHEASSADEALRAIEAGLVPDLIITDHLMPGLTGVELARLIQGRLPDSKILIVSGFAELEAIDPAFPRLTKPFVQSELETAMSELWRSRGSVARDPAG